MQVKTLRFDDFPDELFITYHDGTLSIGTEAGAISSAYVPWLVPEVPHVVQTEPIPPEPETEEEPEHIESEV